MAKSEHVVTQNCVPLTDILGKTQTLFGFGEGLAWTAPFNTGRMPLQQMQSCELGLYGEFQALTAVKLKIEATAGFWLATAASRRPSNQPDRSETLVDWLDSRSFEARNKTFVCWKF